jgi:S-adenosylmethionine-diacylglycerol 3-amino-3-carboxypropyl transferase
MSSHDSAASAPSAVERRVSFDFIRYGNCWEDADVLCDALVPAPGKRVLSIASAGDNCLALAAEGAEVVAADLSLPQLACLELRCAAFRRLDHGQVLAFLGVQATDDRLTTYQRRLQDELTPAARGFWDAQPAALSRGIIHTGKMEGYFRLFRRWVLPLVHSRRTLDRLLEPKDRAGREEFFPRWNNRRWRWAFQLFFNRFLMGRLGRDPEFFRYVEQGVARHFLQRARHGLTVLPTHANPFLDFIVHGNFPRSLPRYLRPEQFDKVRAGLCRLTWHHGSIEQVGRRCSQEGFDAFNLSDIFEYLDVETSRDLYRALVDVARPGARLAYWNTLVPRSRPAELAARVTPLTELSRELFERDLAFFYGAFHVDEVRS